MAENSFVNNRNENYKKKLCKRPERNSFAIVYRMWFTNIYSPHITQRWLNHINGPQSIKIKFPSKQLFLEDVENETWKYILRKLINTNYIKKII